ncbi:MAG: hypothetical protein GX640_15440 [Fibrobacter sp.]|nr:hypothetical protein [Fibrobacter sp.]
MIKNPNDIIEKLTSDCLSIFGDNLISMALFGSAVSHEYTPGVSEITTLILISDNSIASLYRYSSVFEAWSKQKVTLPIFLSGTSLKIFSQINPVQLLDIQSSYRIIYGEDFINDLPIEQEFLRLDCLKLLDRLMVESKSKFIINNGRKKELQNFLEFSIYEMLPLLKALLVLHGKKIPYASTEIISSVEDLFGLGASVLSDIFYNIRNFKGDLGELYDKFISVICLLERSIEESFSGRIPITSDQYDFRK